MRIPRRTFTNINQILDTCVWDGDCLVWLYGNASKNYGRVYFEGKHRILHTVVFNAQCGLLSDNRELHHMCLNKACCNLAHIQVISPSEHMKLHYNGRKYHERARSRTHCKHNHEFTPENTYIRKDGHRACRMCHKIWKREKRRLKKM